MRAWFIVVWVRLSCAVRSKVCIITTLICSAALLLPFLTDMPTGAAYLYDYDAVESQSAFLDEQISSGTYDSAPDELRKLVQKEQGAYHCALAETPTYTAAYYSALADQQEAFAAEGDSGYVDGSVSAKSLTAAYKLTSRISKLQNPCHYASMRQMPALVYLAALPGVMPYLVWFIPSLVVIAAVLSKRGRSFIDQAPLPAPVAALAYAAASFLASCIAAAAMITPAFIATAVSSGLGDASYPTVFIQDGAVVERDCLTQALTGAALFAVLLLALSCLASLALALTKSARASLAALAFLVVPQAFSIYSSDAMPWYSILKLLPSTYFDFRSVTGFFSYANAADISTAPGADFAHGLTVTAILVAISIGSHFAFCLLRRYRRWGWAISDDGTPENPALRIDGVCASYAGTILLDAAELNLSRGTISGLVAPNGCGKTTLLRLLNGSNIAKARGSLTFIASSNSMNAYLVPDFDDACFPYLNVREILSRAAVLFDHESDLNRIIIALGISPILDKRASKCSAGNRQLISIALGLLAQPVVLLLDEPMSALDPINVERVSDALHVATSAGSAVILSSHNLENLHELCDSFLFIKNHRIERLDKEGGIEQNLSQLFKKWYGNN